MYNFDKSIFISIHAPPRGATITGSIRRRGIGFQFTPLREGRQLQRGARNHRRAISIHAPPRGATGIAQAERPHGMISIHAPPRGATAAWTAPSFVAGYFNSRPSARGDVRRWRVRHGDGISIHAPPRGATPPEGFQLLRRCISIHAPPRGATRRAQVVGHVHRHFNSRPSARGDPAYGVDCRNAVLISIHAPPRGATMLDLADAAGLDISIHAPPRGATVTGEEGMAMSIFQFTPLREGRPN